MRIRVAEQEDSKQVALLLAAAFLEYRELYTKEAYFSITLNEDLVGKRISEGRCWVYSNYGDLIASLSSKTLENGLYLRGMVVHPDFHGFGLGRRLLGVAEEFATSNKIHRMYLSTAPFLKRAIGLYETFGFIRTDDPLLELHGVPVFTMEKSLK